MEAVYELISNVQNYEGAEKLKEHEYLTSKFKEVVENISYRDFSKDLKDEIRFNTIAVLYYINGALNELPNNTVKSMKYVILKRNDIINDSKFNKNNKFQLLSFVRSIILYLDLIEGNRKEALDLYDFYDKNLILRDNKFMIYNSELLKYILDITNDYVIALREKAYGYLYLGEGSMRDKIFELKNNQRGNNK